jgi:ribosome biogenesis GTPase
MITDYGWSDALHASAFAAHAALGHIPARVLVQQRGIYGLICDTGELTGQCAGRLLHDAPAGGLPVVGDWVAITARPADHAATIHGVLPRRTCFIRRAAGGAAEQIIAANVDVAFLATSVNADLNPRRLERYLAAAWASGATPVVVLTKSDLTADAQAAVAAVEQVALGVTVLAVSAATGAGLAELAAYLRPGRTCVVVGSSGVGKSTLVNTLAGTRLMATGEIRQQDARGRHTTTHRELFLLPGGALLLDTPGMREFGLTDAPDGLDAVFDDIAALAATCRFSDCSHGTEPGCAVRGAIDAGTLDAARWKSYGKLQRELAREARAANPLARAAVQRRWAVISKAHRQAKKFNDRRLSDGQPS